mmetsp:Transcript_78237/g.229294  ORF Transcript_78237/g.229294 Transcript_78237/m.229294 type:complete len:122 (+) Transcript_78237:79-444(+)
MQHYYPSPGATGATVVPGPHSNPEFRKAAPQSERAGGAAPRQGGTTRLQRSQQSVHDGHIDNLLRQQRRAMTGTIYGNPPDAASSLGNSRGSSSRRSLSSPLIAAGTAAAAPLMGTRVSPD